MYVTMFKIKTIYYANSFFKINFIVQFKIVYKQKFNIFRTLNKDKKEFKSNQLITE